MFKYLLLQKKKKVAFYVLHENVGISQLGSYEIISFGTGRAEIAFKLIRSSKGSTASLTCVLYAAHKDAYLRFIHLITETVRLLHV